MQATELGKKAEGRHGEDSKKAISLATSVADPGYFSLRPPSPHQVCARATFSCALSPQVVNFYVSGHTQAQIAGGSIN